MKKTLTFFKNKSFIILTLWVFPLFVLAEASGGKNSNTIQNPIEATSLSGFFASIVDGLIQLGVIVSVLGIMYGGFLLVTAAGDEEKVSNGRKTITWAMVGTAVLLGAKVIFKIIEGTVNQLT